MRSKREFAKSAWPAALRFGAALAWCFGTLGEPLAAEPFGKAWSNSIGMEFVRIPAGEFTMGGDLQPDDKVENFYVEIQAPAHQVRITQPFYMGRHEVLL